MRDPSVPRRLTDLGTSWKAVLGVRTALKGPARGALEFLGGSSRWARSAGTVAHAVLLLVARIWLSQTVFVHGLMMMMSAGGFTRAPPSWATLMQGVDPLLLAVGLVTRPVALILLLGIGVEGAGSDLTWPRAVLLLWLVARGAGPLSVDFVMRRGLAHVPILAVRVVGRLYASIDRLSDVVLPLGTRLYLALAIAGGSGVAMWPQPISGELITAPWWIILLAWALIGGLATRLTAVILCVVAPLMVLSGTMDDRFGAMVLLLLVAAGGAGKISIDGLLARWIKGSLTSPGQARDETPHVVIVGGGFGGIAAVRALRRVGCRITLIDRRNHYLFQPLLYQVATAALSPADIAIPIRSLVRGQENVAVHLGEVVGVDTTARDVLLAQGRIGFDYLIIATGAQHSYFGRDDWAVHAPGLKSIEDATAMRSRMLRAFEQAESAANPLERPAWLTFVVVGGGPTGVELAGALAELARTGLDQEYRAIDPAMARVILVQSAPRLLPAFSPYLSRHAERALRDLGVEVRTGARVTAIDRDGVEIDDERIAARTTFWAAGVAASPAAKWLNQTADRAGRVGVGDDLSVPGCPGIFAIGDTAASNGWNGSTVPGIAPAAKQQGHHVAGVISAAIGGRSAPPPFRYRHYGNLATIGRLAAVAEVKGLRLWGAPAWWFWGIAHLMFLIGGRNRAAVVLNWLWAYLTYRRSTRLITDGAASATQPSIGSQAGDIGTG
jgi:NADH dehydrogenase FAD-containing subunit